MNTTRRGFMKLLGAGAAGAAVAPLVRSAPEPVSGIDLTKPMEWRAFRHDMKFEPLTTTNDDRLDAAEFEKHGLHPPGGNVLRDIMIEKERDLYAQLVRDVDDNLFRSAYGIKDRIKL